MSNTVFLIVVSICLLVSLPHTAEGAATKTKPISEAGAAEYYASQQWQKSVEAYESLTVQDADNFRAWYRLARSLIKIGDGASALRASEQARRSPVIPRFYLDYQQAQVHQLLENETAMWKALENSALSGFSSLSTISANKSWDNIRGSSRFIAFMAAVELNASPCAQDERYQHFDFWLGHWEVYGNKEKSGPLYGRNHVEKTENACLILEHWQGSGGTTGTSMNYYNGLSDRWVQNWVSAGGTTIDYNGGLINGAMVLVGKVFDLVATNNNPQVRDIKGTWTPLENGVVRQTFEESQDKGKTWVTTFDGYYFPIED